MPTRTRQTCILAIMAMLLATACHKAEHELSRERKAELRQLAHDYAFKHVDEAESLAIRERIRSLPVDEARFLHIRLREQSGAKNELGRRLQDALFEYAAAHRKSFLDLTRDEVRRVLSEVSGVPVEKISKDF